ncbi:MAG TPA: DUF3105 domain-containing protein [Nocardioidaceae bacterium]|nr:DUF3105 domain-containing protein [Nocardioidaceae bacterium]
MAKSSKDRDRRAIVEEMRKKQQAQERRRTLLAFLAALAVAAVIIGFALVQYLDARQKESRDLSDIGVAKSAASCQPVKRESAEGNQQHVASGVKVDYDAAPPAYGEHDGNYLRGAEVKNFYTVDDRPPVERLVHSLEHGYTIVWYDESIADDDAAMDDVRAIASRYPVGDYVMVAPWTKEDGDAFPEETHIAMTHWTGGEDKDQEGIWQYCGKVSGESVQTFVEDFPKSNSPEPNGG